MTRIKTFVLLCALTLATGLDGQSQRATQPSITYGTVAISLGMTVEQIEQRLAGAGRHIKTQPDGVTTLVYVNGDPNGVEGQITFSSGRAVYADYKMPVVDSADELAQEIAGAVDNIETKTCEASNYSAHGTGGGFSQVIFQCGARRFNVMTSQILGSPTRAVNVNIEIGQIAAK